jgi:TonB-linked outer membrane protein, SusC/RagA family
MKRNLRLMAMLWPIVTIMCLEARAQSPDVSGAVPPGTDTTSNVQDTITIEEVQVNTGYQRLPKERATGSFVQIDNELLNRSVSTNLLERLDGITNSVLFDKRGAKPRIQVRGLNTLTQHMSEPLIVVDNFPYEGDIGDINPNDVENITVLKDAAASSIWGARAANGVIVITTKRGAFNKPGRVHFNSNVTIMERTNLFDRPEPGPKDIIEMEKFLFDKGYFDAQIADRTGFPALTPVVEILAAQRDGRLSEQEAMAELGRLSENDARKDFEKYIYRPAVNQQYNAGISGGAGNISYYLSAGVDKNIEELVGNTYDRVSLRSTTTYRPYKTLTVEIGLGYTEHRDINNSLGGYGSAAYKFGSRTMPNYHSLLNEDGGANSIDLDYRALFTDTAGNGMLLDWKYRPLDEMAVQDRSSRGRAMTGNLAINYEIAPFLVADVRYQYQQTQRTDRDYYSGENFYARNLINLFSVPDGGEMRYGVPNDGILDLTTTGIQSHSIRGQLNFENTYGLHSINAFAGGEARQAMNAANMYRTYGYSDVLTTSNVDYVNRLPTFAGIAGNILVPNNAWFSDITNRYISVYANAGYSFRSTYHVTASVRKDASNLFGVKANRRGVPLWSAGVKWDIAKERFYRISAFPYLAFRATYGYGGNVNTGMSAYTTIEYRSANEQPTNVPYAIISQRPNPNLRWEKTRTINMALDFREKEGSVSGSIEYYFKKSTDVLGMEPLDPTVGTASLLTNSAHINGEGLDVQLRFSMFKRRPVHWNLSTNFNYVTYKVTRYLTERSMLGYASSGGLISPFVGYNPYLLVSHRWAGLDPETGDPMGYVGGEISKDYRELLRNPGEEQVIHGPALPPFFGNIINTLTYKQLALSFNITWRMGHYTRLSSVNYGNLFATGNPHIDYLRRWQTPGDEKYTDVPSLVYPNPSVNRDSFYGDAEVNVINSSSIRFTDIRLSYDFTIPRLATNLRLYGYLSNLNVMLWKANDKGIDPEYPEGLLPNKSMAVGLAFDF